jgi:Cu(I)/Ag(I) efflux system membrane fusion protein
VEAAVQNNVELKDAKVQAIYDGYIALKNALVSTNFEEAKKTAVTLGPVLAAYKGCENTA